MSAGLVLDIGTRRTCLKVRRHSIQIIDIEQNDPFPQKSPPDKVSCTNWDFQEAVGKITVDTDPILSDDQVKALRAQIATANEPLPSKEPSRQGFVYELGSTACSNI
jgi:hypothetical protein